MNEFSVHVVSSPGIFRDLLSSKLAQMGINLKSQISLDEKLQNVEATDSIIIHIPERLESRLAQLQEFREAHPDNLVTLLCSPGMEQLLHAEMDFWANAIIPNTKPMELVVETLKVVSHGYSVIDSNIVQSPAHPVLVESSDAPSHCMMDEQMAELSNREIAVMKEIRAGRSNKEIARTLNISDSTVKVHIRSIFRKIGVRNRTEAAIWISSRCRNREETPVAV